MAKAKVLKIPARGDWEFAEVETEADGNIPLEAMQSMVGGWVERWELHGHGLEGLDLFLTRRESSTASPTTPRRRSSR